MLGAQLAVFVSGGHSAADVTLPLVFVQHLLHRRLQIRIDLQQPEADIFMNGAFAEVEHLCRLPHGSFVVHYVVAQHDSPLFRDAFQTLSLLFSRTGDSCHIDMRRVVKKELEKLVPLVLVLSHDTCYN